MKSKSNSPYTADCITTSAEMMKKYMQKKRESALRHNQRKKIKEYEEANNIKLNPDELTEELLSEIMNAKKRFKAKRGTPKYGMSKFKIIKPMDGE